MKLSSPDNIYQYRAGTDFAMDGGRGTAQNLGGTDGTRPPGGPGATTLNLQLSTIITRLLRYFAALTTGRIVLWCYAIWYAVNVTLRFDTRPRLWVTSLGLSGIIGLALLLSTRASSTGTTRLDGWQIFRLFLMPFCVSSFAALVKDAGYVLIFPPSVRENCIGGGFISLFLLGLSFLRAFYTKPGASGVDAVRP